MEYEKRAEGLEHEAERLEEHSEEVGEDIEEARRDWEQKEQDTSVPGAQAPEKEEGERAGLDSSFDAEEDKQ